MFSLFLLLLFILYTLIPNLLKSDEELQSFIPVNKIRHVLKIACERYSIVYNKCWLRKFVHL